MKLLDWLWDNRTKVVGYLGAALAQLATTGLVTNARVVGFIAFAASLCTLAIGHFNDYQNSKQGPAQ